MPATSMNPNLIPLSLAFFAMAILIMWFSAGVVGVRRPGLGQSLLSTMGVSVIAGAVVTAVSSLGMAAAIVLGSIGVIGVIWVIRSVFKIPTLPALLIFVVNIMVQMILISVYLRAMMPPPPTK